MLLDTELLVGLIGAGATVFAAVIGAIALLKTQKQGDQLESPTTVNKEFQLPYGLHRDEMERKEKEVRELMKVVLLYEQQAQLNGKELAAATQFRDNLSDYFEDVSDESKLELDIYVNIEGKVVVFYNKPLKVELLRAELFVGERALVFVALSGSRRFIGLALSEGVVQPIAQCKPEKLLFVQMDPSTNLAIKGEYISLRVYDPHPTEKSLQHGSPSKNSA